MSRATFLASITGTPRHIADIRTIIATVAARHGVAAAMIRGRCKKRRFAWPRQEVMAIARNAGYTLSQISVALGGIDHSSILYGANAHEERASK